MDKLRSLFARNSSKRWSHPSPVSDSHTAVGSPADHTQSKTFSVSAQYSSDAFFALCALGCFAANAGFQSKNGIKVSFLNALMIAVALIALILPVVLAALSFAYERHNKCIGAARFLSVLRTQWVFNGGWLSFTFLAAFITTISAVVSKGCKNPDDDPNAALGDDFKSGLMTYCNNRKAGTVFFWLAAVSWAVSVILTYRSYQNSSHRRELDNSNRDMFPDMGVGMGGGGNRRYASLGAGDNEMEEERERERSESVMPGGMAAFNQEQTYPYDSYNRSSTPRMVGSMPDVTDMSGGRASRAAGVMFDEGGRMSPAAHGGRMSRMGDGSGIGGGRYSNEAAFNYGEAPIVGDVPYRPGMYSDPALLAQTRSLAQMAYYGPG